MAITANRWSRTRLVGWCPSISTDDRSAAIVHVAVCIRLTSTTWPSPVRSTTRSAARIAATIDSDVVWSPWAEPGCSACWPGIVSRSVIPPRPKNAMTS